jgi:hypothetical protein
MYSSLPTVGNAAAGATAFHLEPVLAQHWIDSVDELLRLLPVPGDQLSFLLSVDTFATVGSTPTVRLALASAPGGDHPKCLGRLLGESQSRSVHDRFECSVHQ